MADVPIITPSKPLWPTRRDGKKPADKHREEDDSGEKQDDSKSDETHITPPDNKDGHIDEYV